MSSTPSNKTPPCWRICPHCTNPIRSRAAVIEWDVSLQSYPYIDYVANAKDQSESASSTGANSSKFIGTSRLRVPGAVLGVLRSGGCASTRAPVSSVWLSFRWHWPPGSTMVLYLCKTWFSYIALVASTIFQVFLPLFSQG